MIRSFARRWYVIVVAAGAALACSGRREAPKVPLAKNVTDPNAVEAAHALIGPAAKAALDSGNVLFRHKAYAAALAQYRAASALAPQHSAPLFGIYMVARATNNPAMADSALAGIRLRGGAMTPTPHVPTDTALQRIHENFRKRPSSD